MLMVGLDLGTTFIKGALLDLDAPAIQGVRRLPFPGAVTGLPALHYEVEAGQVADTVRALLDELLATAPDCAGIVLCTQMHGLVLSTETGEPRSNIITWQDQRILSEHPAGGNYFDRLSAQVSVVERQQLGHELQPSRPLCYLYWLAEQGALPAEPIYPVGVGDFVVAHLCRTTPVMEATNAGSHCALNLEAMTWHHAVLERLGLAHLQWPALRPFGSVVGEYRHRGRMLPVYTPVGDHQCSVVGALLAEDELSLNISTGSQASLLTADWQPGDYQTRPFFDDRFLNTISGIPAGRALNLLVNLLTELPRSQGVMLDDPWTYIADAAAGVPETDLTVNLAFFGSAGGKQGQIAHIREQNLTVGHLFHAAFQNMAENYYAAGLRLSPAQAWRGLVFSGGLAQKIAVLRQLVERKFQRPYRTSPSSEDSLLGLLVLGLVAAGRYPTVGEATSALRTTYQETATAKENR
jgi:sugar (pentulose or hexulose) kinase